MCLALRRPLNEINGLEVHKDDCQTAHLDNGVDARWPITSTQLVNHQKVTDDEPEIQQKVVSRQDHGLDCGNLGSSIHVISHNRDRSKDVLGDMKGQQHHNNRERGPRAGKVLTAGPWMSSGLASRSGSWPAPCESTSHAQMNFSNV